MINYKTEFSVNKALIERILNKNSSKQIQKLMLDKLIQDKEIKNDINDILINKVNSIDNKHKDLLFYSNYLILLNNIEGLKKI